MRSGDHSDPHTSRAAGLTGNRGPNASRGAAPTGDPAGDGDGHPFLVEAPSLSLPTGGGAIRSIDEQFAVNAATGTMSLSLPLPLTPAPRDFTPPLRLSYDSGSGNGIAGLGWSLTNASIRRRTDRAVPGYTDDDTFALAGGDDLVPAATWDGSTWELDVEPAGPLTVERFRPRNEGDLARIERIADGDGATWWRVMSRDDVTTFFGLDERSQITDPAHPDRILAWLPALSFDDVGNCCVYDYAAEDLAGVPVRRHDANRRSHGDDVPLAPFANRHPVAIRYGNRAPYYVDEASPHRPLPPAGAFRFHVAFDYGQHDAAVPTPDDGGEWSPRPDPFSTYRAGFEVRTNRLLQRVLLFHQFDGLRGGEPCLVRSLDLAYATSSNVSLLASATQSGYAPRPDGTYSKRSLPPLELDYQALEWNTALRTVDAESAGHLPSGVAGNYQWVDLHGEGIAGVLAEQTDAWFYQHNLGDAGGTGQLRLGHQRLVTAKPSVTGLASGALRLLQLDADGRRQIAVQTPQLQGYFALEDTAGDDDTAADDDTAGDDTGDGSTGRPAGPAGLASAPFRPYPNTIHVDLTSAHVRQLDLVGDGRADILVADDGAFIWFRSLGTGGHEAARRAPHPAEGERAPAVVFHDSVQSLFLADMSGDGLVDIVRVRNGDVSYWPNLGYGRFGARVAMDDAPQFDHPDAFHPGNLRLADITGTGTADIVYLGRNDCHAYLNHSGNAWSERVAIGDLPAPRPVDVATVDLFGNGTTCLVWSSALPADAGRSLRYVDPTGGHKPHLLCGYRNNLGREVSVTYRPSTWFSTRDKLAGRPWITRLPFPVQCVERVEQRDGVAGSRRTSTYAYRHGYFDAAEREFRGFAIVDRVDAEDFANWSRDGTSLIDRTLYQTPVLTRTWFHTGAGDGRRSLVARLHDERWDRRLIAAGFATTSVETPVAPIRVETAAGITPPPPGDAAATERDRALARNIVRACRGTVLRREVFALDAPDTGATADQRRLQLTPFTVAAAGSSVVVVQPPLAGAPAVVKVEQRETVTWIYERQVDDPRVEQRINVRFDDLGNVCESAHIAYGRRSVDAALPAATRDAQRNTGVTYTVIEFTPDVVDAAHHRLRVPARTTTYEIAGLSPAGPVFASTDFRGDGFDVVTDSVEHDAADLTPAAAGEVHRRVRHRKESTYFDADAATRLQVGQLDARALPFESYELAATPDLLADVFADVLPAADTSAVMAEGGYVQRDGDWYVPSGRWEYLGPGESVDDARARGFAHVAMTDALGGRTTVGYRSGDGLLRNEIVDAAGNRTVVTDFDLRTLSPSRIVDPNGNVSAVVLDEVGMTKASAIIGKVPGDADDLAGMATIATPAETTAVAAFWAATESTAITAAAATLLGVASSRQVYDIDRYRATAGVQPPVVATIVRERHAADDPGSPVQVTFEYSNGAGKVEMTKAPAEPGAAARARLLADGSVAVDEVDTAALVPPQPRWIGTGRRLVDNKGNVVKEYEPFFSVSPAFETARELVESGVTKVVSYDPVDRPARIDFPDGTFSETAHSAWAVVESDRNDTIERSTWHADRVGRLIDAALTAQGRDPAAEAEAAARAAAHRDTPFTRHLDPFGRPILEVEHNGDDPANPGQPELLNTALVVDIDGRRTSITDPRGITTVTYRHDRRGTMLSYDGPDGGRRWLLNNVVGEPVRLWDQRNHELSFAYDDALHRVTAKRVRGGDGPQPLDHVYERVVYGEGRPGDTDANLRTRIAVRYDTAGRSTNDRFDLHGNLAGRTRRFATDYRATPNWDVADPDALLDAETFSTTEAYDALDRVTLRSTPDGAVHEPVYNAGNLLEAVRVTNGGVTEVVVADIDYDARGMRRSITLGNGVTTTYRYDAQTFRLVGLTSRRANGEVLQDLACTYDPVGNLTHQADAAVPTVWFSNAMVTGESAYRYDPTYRLVEATGREHAGQLAFGTGDNSSDAAMLARHDPGDVLAWRNYTQRYRYDAAGNIEQFAHAAGADGSWTRDNTYDATSNRLLSTSVGGQPYPVGHHPDHGYVDSLAHLSVMRWNFREELQAVASQRVAGGIPQTTWYVYDGDGLRVRKVTDAMVTAADAAAGVLPARRFERYTVEGVEIERQYAAGAITLQRHTTHVTDDTGRVAMIERDTTPGGGPGGADAPRLVRYQLANHLGSATIEVDAAARVISYEEYHPFGTTAYQGVDKTVAAAKRFRYTGMERDDESGLEHHAARYYIPWLGRWLSPDRHADQLDGNRYAYVRNNPLAHRDRNGQYEEPVHGAATYRLALAAGFTEVDAARIAIATAGMDHDKATSPGDNVWEMQKQIWLGRTQRYHFPSQEKALADVRSDIDKGVNDLEQFGRHLHSLEDVGFQDAPGPHMRGNDRLLSPATGMIGIALIGAAALTAVKLVYAGHSEWAAVAGGLLLAFGLYAFIFALRADGVGHPTYVTEKGANSHSFSHVADEAYQDPELNTRQLNKVYAILKEAAEARYGHPVATDDAAAGKAIADVVAEGRTDAETAAMINAYVNARPNDANGNPVMSYSEAIEQFAQGRWTPNEIDASVNDKPVKHTPQMVPIR